MLLWRTPLGVPRRHSVPVVGLFLTRVTSIETSLSAGRTHECVRHTRVTSAGLPNPNRLLISIKSWAVMRGRTQRQPQINVADHGGLLTLQDRDAASLLLSLLQTDWKA